MKEKGEAEDKIEINSTIKPTGDISMQLSTLKSIINGLQAMNFFFFLFQN